LTFDLHFYSLFTENVISLRKKNFEVMKQLPIGIQSFEKLRKKGCIYVDKTEEIYNLVTSENIVFLSRPRRFGKSLLVSTMDELFRGNKSLFEGLYIYDKWDWTQQYPVIRIDWTRITHSTPEKMEVSLRGYLQNIAKRYDVSLTAESAPDCFDAGAFYIKNMRDWSDVAHPDGRMNHTAPQPADMAGGVIYGSASINVAARKNIRDKSRGRKERRCFTLCGIREISI
jgi:hypothetical protein